MSEEVKDARGLWEAGLGPFLRAFGLEQYFLMLLLVAEGTTDLKELYKKYFQGLVQLPVNCPLSEEWAAQFTETAFQAWNIPAERNLMNDLKEVWRLIQQDRETAKDWILETQKPGGAAFAPYFEAFLDDGRKVIFDDFSRRNDYYAQEVFSTVRGNRFVAGKLAGKMVFFGLWCWLRVDRQGIRVMLVADTSRFSNDYVRSLKEHLPLSKALAGRIVEVDPGLKKPASTFIVDIPMTDWFQEELVRREQPIGGWDDDCSVILVAQDGFLPALEKALQENGIPVSDLAMGT